MNLARARERWRHGIKAELPENVFPDRVINSRYHPGHLKDLPSDLGRHYVPVIAIGQRGEAIRLLDPRSPEDILVDAIPQHHVAGKVGAQPVEGSAVVFLSRH